MDVEFHNGKILHGDVLERLKDIPDKSVDVEITSPPYWGLRDYGIEGQFGLESDFRDYLKVLYRIMDELKRVLKSTGTCWINLGDSYGTHKGYDGFSPSFTERKPVKNYEKSRLGIPERFYIQCIDDGWIARNHIPWYKSNSMPSSIKDRFTNKWESVFFFAKEKRYYFNLDAVREKTLTDSKPFNIRVRDNISGLAQQKLGDQAWTATQAEMDQYNKDGTRKQDSTLGADGKPIATYKGFNKRWKKLNDVPGQSTQNLHGNRDGIEAVNNPKGKNPGDFFVIREENAAQDQYTQRVLEARKNGAPHDNPLGDTKGKNPGDVFFINPRPFPEAHFATFPPELPEKIIKCACPEGGTVLDPFFGSGTVGLVAEQLNKKWIGIELSEEYIEICKRRLAPYNSMRLDEFV